MVNSKPVKSISRKIRVAFKFQTVGFLVANAWRHEAIKFYTDLGSRGWFRGRWSLDYVSNSLLSTSIQIATAIVRPW